MINSTTSDAQISIGSQVGYYINDITTNSLDRNTYRGGLSCSYGLILKLKFNKSIYLKLKAFKIEKEYSNLFNNLNPNIKEKTSNSYLQMPISIGFQLSGNKIQPCFDFGFYGSYCLSSKSAGRIANIFNVKDHISSNGAVEDIDISAYKTNNRLAHRFRLGATIGVGANYVINRRLSLLTSLNYYYSYNTKYIGQLVSTQAKLFKTLGIETGVLFNIQNR